MKTPITDAAEFPAHQATRFHYGEDPLVDASLARRLELDRAALMAALEAMLDLWQKVGGNESDWAVEKSETALSTARANFPPSHP